MTRMLAIVAVTFALSGCGSSSSHPDYPAVRLQSGASALVMHTTGCFQYDVGSVEGIGKCLRYGAPLDPRPRHRLTAGRSEPVAVSLRGASFDTAVARLVAAPGCQVGWHTLLHLTRHTPSFNAPPKAGIYTVRLIFNRIDSSGTAVAVFVLRVPPTRTGSRPCPA